MANLLREIEERAKEQGLTFSGAKKSSKQDPESVFGGEIIKDFYVNQEVIEGTYQLIAGTAWLFADPGLEATLD